MDDTKKVLLSLNAPLSPINSKSASSVGAVTAMGSHCAGNVSLVHKAVTVSSTECRDFLEWG